MHDLGPRSVGHERRHERDGAQDRVMAAVRAGERIVAAAFGVDAADLRAPGRGPHRTAFARQVAMYLAHVTLQVPLADVGRHFGRDRTTAGYACARIEDRRDDERTDRILHCLEVALDRWRRCFLDGVPI